MPYTAMYVAAISMGFTTADLHEMPPDRLLWFIHQNNVNNGAQGEPERDDEPREGTIEELKRII